MLGLLDGLVPLLCMLIFAAVLVGFAAIAVKGIGTWNKNNHSPRLAVEAKVVGKRMDISQHQQANAGDITGTHGYSTFASISYYATFQTADGNRMEFFVSGEEYGLLAEGDTGTLTYQGTRYLSFQRRS